MSLNEFEQFLASFVEEKYQPIYGIHRWQNADSGIITAVSAASWDQYIKFLAHVNTSDRVVVSPELITGVSEGSTKEVTMSQIKERINHVAKLSTSFPLTTFLLGTAYSTDGSRPTNSVLYIKLGKIIGLSNKRTGVNDWERNTFTQVVDEPAAIIPDTNIGLLICSDFAIASFLARQSPYEEEVLRARGASDLIGRKRSFIHPEAKTIIVPSCWGVGSQCVESDPTRHYKLQLRNLAVSLFRSMSTINHIISIDRTRL